MKLQLYKWVTLGYSCLVKLFKYWTKSNAVHVKRKILILMTLIKVIFKKYIYVINYYLILDLVK